MRQRGRGGAAPRAALRGERHHDGGDARHRLAPPLRRVLRTGSQACTTAASTVIEKNTLPSVTMMSDSVAGLAASDALRDCFTPSRLARTSLLVTAIAFSMAAAGQTPRGRMTALQRKHRGRAANRIAAYAAIEPGSGGSRRRNRAGRGSGQLTRGPAARQRPLVSTARRCRALREDDGEGRVSRARRDGLSDGRASARPRAGTRSRSTTAPPPRPRSGSPSIGGAQRRRPRRRPRARISSWPASATTTTCAR